MWAFFTMEMVTVSGMVMRSRRDESAHFEPLKLFVMARVFFGALVLIRCFDTQLSRNIRFSGVTWLSLNVVQRSGQVFLRKAHILVCRYSDLQGVKRSKRLEFEEM